MCPRVYVEADEIQTLLRERLHRRGNPLDVDLAKISRHVSSLTWHVEPKISAAAIPIGQYPDTRASEEPGRFKVGIVLIALHEWFRQISLLDRNVEMFETLVSNAAIEKVAATFQIKTIQNTECFRKMFLSFFTSHEFRLEF